MTHIKVSIIVPVYNNEKYIYECLDSLIGQTLSEIEIITVDDGSTDNSLMILKKYQENHENFIVIHQQNQKLGSARNTGLRIAKGEYVLFVDSDDYIHGAAAEELYHQGKQYDLDLITFDAEVFEEQGDVSDNDVRKGLQLDRTRIGIPDDKVFTGKDYLKLYGTSGGMAIPVFMQMYKTSFLRQHNFSFQEQVFYEDNEFSVKSYLLAQRMMYFSKKLYSYRLHAGSIISSPKTLPHVIGGMLGSKRIWNYLVKCKLMREPIEAVNRVLGSMLRVTVDCLEQVDTVDKKQFTIAAETFLNDYLAIPSKELEDYLDLEILMELMRLLNHFERRNQELEQVMVEKMRLLGKTIQQMEVLFRKNIISFFSSSAPGILAEGKVSGKEADRDVFVIYGIGEIGQRILRYLCPDKTAVFEKSILFCTTKEEVNVSNGYPVWKVDYIGKYSVKIVFIGSTKYEGEMIEHVGNLYGNQYDYITYRQLARCPLPKDKMNLYLSAMIDENRSELR
jgi:glycosyltransferase involved in cell wall biosynthesis